MKNSYFSAATSRIFCYFGEIFDLFTDESLVPMSLPQLLHQDLRCQGYERIIFLDYTEGVTFLDAASRKLFQGKSAVPRVHGATKGKLLSNRGAAAVSQPARRDSLSYNIAPAEMIRYAGEFMRNGLIKTAIICSDGLNMLEHLQREGDNGSMLNDLFKKIESIHDPCNRNVMIFLFDRSEGQVADFFHGQRWTYVWESLKKRAVFHHIPPVPAPEIRLALHYLRLAGIGGKRLELDQDHLEDICQMIAGKIQRNINEGETGAKYTGTEELSACQLKALMQHLLDHFMAPGKILNLEACQKMCGQDMKKPAMEQLDELTGMQELKEKIRAYIGKYHGETEKQVQPLRLEPPACEGKKAGPNLHFVITGKKGTGKSTAARLIGEIFGEYGLLPSGHMVETQPSKLIGQYIGHSEANMRDAIERARGGVLFIDEAYGFAASGHETNSYHQGMVNELVASMTSHPGEYAVVLAGYPDEMEHMFSTVNPGLRERFGNHIHIEDYSPEELACIFRKKAHDRGLSVSGELDHMIVDFFGNWYADCQDDWANGRNAENLVNDMAVAACDHVLTPELLPAQLQKYASDEQQQSVKQQLAQMVGLSGVKQTIRDFENKLRYSDRQNKRNYHFVFAGNPGTGKTTIAEIFGHLLKGAGVLKSGTVRKVEAGSLIKNPDALAREISRCKDRVLLIDEAYQLLQNPYLIDQLVEKTNPDKTEFPFCVVCTGYEDKMKTFMQYNEGMARRFQVIHFEDYTPEDLLQILCIVLKNKYGRYGVTEGFLHASLAHFQKYRDIIGEKYNGGYIGRYLDEVEKILYRQFNTVYENEQPPEDAYCFTDSSVPDYLV
ncbi:SpoVK/Ycf46/Vps4 family AAA+-type ATPase [Catenibacillus scindens]|uniref:SpoVK/Ycf46/Vps4 family AAA+-type ATPase n=1 Tax=Catenibacillus scindens TaxID=673271 RepID=A0A7W8HBU8_9FIRM|nr:AAA family ATPase [Catenibacillus scindens]MBB5265621.1 SpoVK/Ycf46/Vps4 family AAA+-type ATPase [Catenibacillus scindens]